VKFTRQEFIKLGVLAFLGLALGGVGRYVLRLLGIGSGLDPTPEDPEGADPGQPREEQRPPPEPRRHPPADEEDDEDEDDMGWERKLGATGVEVGLVGLGGAGLISRADRGDDAVQLIERALDLGVNYIDTAPTYADGVSERHIGQVMKGRRDEVVLATKTLDRTYDETMRLAESSLTRLQTGHLDVYQLHGIRDREDAREALRPDGAVRALQELRDEGVVRFTGITGHRDPDPLRFLLERADFDCVLIPLNPAEVHYNSFKDGLLDLAVEKELGIIAMKVAAYGRLFHPDGVSSMRQSLRYVGSLPISTAIVGHDSVEQLEENVHVCRDLRPYHPGEMRELEALARPHHDEANFYKTEW